PISISYNQRPLFLIQEIVRLKYTSKHLALQRLPTHQNQVRRSVNPCTNTTNLRLYPEPQYRSNDYHSYSDPIQDRRSTVRLARFSDFRNNKNSVDVFRFLFRQDQQKQRQIRVLILRFCHLEQCCQPSFSRTSRFESCWRYSVVYRCCD